MVVIDLHDVGQRLQAMWLRLCCHNKATCERDFGEESLNYLACKVVDH